MIGGLHGSHATIGADTVVSPASVEAARLAAGAAIGAIEAICGSPARARRAFAAMRPPGHHAEEERAMGFCLYNNIAVAAAHARARFGLERILILDWDVHYGNGTQQIFAAERGVLFASIHQSPLYPGGGATHEVGQEAGRGFTINLPLPAGCGDGDYAAAFDRLLLPIAARYRPQLVLVSAGFDAHAADPLGGMELTAEGFAALTARARRIAEQHAQGRLLLLLEGGYDLHGLASSVHACLAQLVAEEAAAAADAAAVGEAMAGAASADLPPAPPATRRPAAPPVAAATAPSGDAATTPGGAAALERALHTQREFWPGALA
jgi:acetoin utilization deacetylase AcuC-like enzyme